MIKIIKDKINFLYSNYMTENLIKKYKFVEKKKFSSPRVSLWWLDF